MCLPERHASDAQLLCSSHITVDHHSQRPALWCRFRLQTTCRSARSRRPSGWTLVPSSPDTNSPSPTWTKTTSSSTVVQGCDPKRRRITLFRPDTREHGITEEVGTSGAMTTDKFVMPTAVHPRISELTPHCRKHKHGSNHSSWIGPTLTATSDCCYV